jgi:hypothetical protein
VGISCATDRNNRRNGDACKSRTFLHLTVPPRTRPAG